MAKRVRVGVSTVVVALVLNVAGSVDKASVAYPAPAPPPPVSDRTLHERYEGNQRAVAAALVVARQHADHRRARTLEALTGRNLLAFDSRGSGRAVEVLGDLAGADRIAVLVPGSHTTLDTFDRNRGPGGGARALAAELQRVDPATRVATVAWLGYDTPQGVDPRGATHGLARAGAEELRATVAELRRVNAVAPISLLCHSYGSVVCAYAAGGLPVSDLVLYGSPGVGVPTAADLSTPARVWTARATGDWIRFVPSTRVAGVGFGPDPTAGAFGARPFPAGDGGHGDYHLRGSESLRSLARIALGVRVHG